MKSPKAKREKHLVKFNQENLVDYYYWLRDDDRNNKEVLNYLKKENNYCKFIMEKSNNLQKILFNELKSYINENEESIHLPLGKNGWDSKYYYFSKTIENKSYPIHFRINQKTKKREIILDQNLLAKNKKTFDLKNFKITDDHKYMSYGLDLSGKEKYKIFIINVDTKDEIDHNIPIIPYASYLWNKNTIYYSLGTKENRINQIWLYDIISKKNKLIYKNDNNLVSVGINRTTDRKYFIISANSFDTSDIYYFTDNNHKLNQFTKKIDKLIYTIYHHENNFFILTNKDNSTNFKIMITSSNKTNIENWKDFIPYNDNIYIKFLHILKNFLIISFKENGNSYLKVINYINNKYDVKNSYIIKLDDKTSNISLLSLDIYDTNKIIFKQESLKNPNIYFKYNLLTKEKKLLKKKNIPNYNPNDYTTERKFAISIDGTKIPMSIIYKTELIKKDGTNPLYLYGYGAYGITVNPIFKSSILPLINRGFIYVIAHVRGGSFLGYKWYEDGKMLNKMNSFKDFISCAKYLINNNYTNNKGITIEGRSAGGLLVGAAMTMEPELFRTVIAGVPFVDVLNTMIDPSIPLTTSEWKQWGNPNDKKYFDYIKKYSPYDNINFSKYPNILLLSGLNDPRVQYWEPSKFTAKLRYYNKSKNLILLKTELDQGHFGSIDRYKYLNEIAFNYSFIFKTYNLFN